MPLLLPPQLRKLRQKRTSLALQKTQSVADRDRLQWKHRASRMLTARTRPRHYGWSRRRQSNDVRLIFRTMLRRERAHGRARLIDKDSGHWSERANCPAASINHAVRSACTANCYKSIICGRGQGAQYATPGSRLLQSALIHLRES